jgi:NADPH-dependent 2,4-dienoyl-CoA reductase/sulfur reductase-like enzyme
MRTRRLVVVGASLAGLRAVEIARRIGFDGAITLIGAEAHPPYDRPPLSKAFLDSGEEPEIPEHRPLAELRDELGVGLMLGEPATALVAQTREVLLADRAIRYDMVVIATGSAPRALSDWSGRDGVHTMRTVEDARAVRAALDKGARTVVVGAGFIGAEVASAARRRGLDVTVVEAAAAPLARAVGPDMGTVCAGLHAANGVDLRCGVTVTGIADGDGGRRVELSDGSSVPADLVVVGVGAEPATGWLANSGLAIADGVACDETLCAGPDGVYAAGDVANWWNPLFGRRMRLQHWTNAAEQGELAVRNAMAPMSASPCATVPYFWSDWYGTRIQFAGLPDGEPAETFGDVAGFRFLVLYRTGDRLTGALAVGRPADGARLRTLIRRSTAWPDAVEFAAGRVRVR